MIDCEPSVTYFKPRGVPMTGLEKISLAMDEFEALRLKDLEGLEQEQAATTMNVSQPTFHRILESAHKKVADALVKGKAIRIEGGDYVIREKRRTPVQMLRMRERMARTIRNRKTIRMPEM